MDGKVPMEIGYVSYGRMWTDASHSSCRVTSQYATLVPQLPRFPHANQDTGYGDPISFLQVVVIVREQGRYRHFIANQTTALFHVRALYSAIFRDADSGGFITNTTLSAIIGALLPTETLQTDRRHRRLGIQASDFLSELTQPSTAL
jgi:hypothetical protein